MSIVDKTFQQTVRSMVLADDDPDDHYFFRGALSEADPQIILTIVENGEALLQLLTNYLPDIIFLDLDMPGKNGLECLTSLRNKSVTRNIPIVIFSSTSRPANIETAYEMGADLFFIKPASYHELKDSVKAILDLNWKDPSEVKERFFKNGKYTAFT